MKAKKPSEATATTVRASIWWKNIKREREKCTQLREYCREKREQEIPTKEKKPYESERDNDRHCLCALVFDRNWKGVCFDWREFKNEKKPICKK